MGSGSVYFYYTTSELDVKSVSGCTRFFVSVLNLVTKSGFVMVFFVETSI